MGSLPDSQYIIQTDGYYFVESHDVDPSKGYITVSAKGIVNGLSNIPNDGADFGPDSYNPNYSGSGIPYTQTSGIQEAHDYIKSKYPGIVADIILMAGIYYIYGTLTLHNVRIIGQGISTAIVEKTANVTPIVFNPGTPPSGNQSSDQYHNIGLINLAVQNPTTGTLTNGMIYFESGYDILVTRVWVTCYSTPTGDGIVIGGNVSGGRTEISYCWLEGINGHPINSAIPLYIHNNYFYVCTDSVYVNAGMDKNSTSIMGNYLLAAFLEIVSTQLLNISNNIISEPSFSSSQNAAITLTSVSQAMINGNTIDSQNGALASYGVSVATSNYVQVENNDLRGNTVNGIQWDGTGTENIFMKNTGYSTSPSLSANPPVSATVYQNTLPYDIEIDLPVYATTSGTAGYVTIAKGSSSSSLTTIGNQFVNGSTSSTSVDIIRLRVPAGWYYEFTASGVTFGTASVFAD